MNCIKIEHKFGEPITLEEMGRKFSLPFVIQYGTIHEGGSIDGSLTIHKNDDEAICKILTILSDNLPSYIKYKEDVFCYNNNEEMILTFNKINVVNDELIIKIFNMEELNSLIAQNLGLKIYEL